jgi:hypothetical protein
MADGYDLGECKAALRALVWAARRVVRESVVGSVPPTRQSMELLSEALRDPRIRVILG